MTQRQRSVGLRLAGFALVALALVAIPLAAPGSELVPGAASGAPDWLLGIYGAGIGTSPTPFLVLLYVAVLLWAIVIVCGEGLPRGWIRIAAGGLIALFALAPPLLSLDVFSYISYARLGVEGMNPYDFAPDALPGDDAASRVEDFRSAVSVYGPLFTAGSYPLGLLSVPAALWSLKAIAAASVGGIALLTAKLAALRGVDPAMAAAFVALNPLVLVHAVGGAHNDSLMVLLAMLGIAFALTARPVLAAVGLVGSAAVKVSAALYTPFAAAGGSDRRRLLIGLVGVGGAVAAAALIGFGSGVLEAIDVAGGNQERVSRWSVPGTLARGTGIDVDLLRVSFGVIYLLVVAWLLVRVARGADWVQAAAWAVFGLLVASAYMVPWYLIWLLPLAAIARDRALIWATILLTVFQVVNAVPV